MKLVIPADTSPEAHAIQMEIYRRMTPSQRMKIALEMSDAMRRISLNGIRARHPEMSEEQRIRELIRLMHGITVEP